MDLRIVETEPVRKGGQGGCVEGWTGIHADLDLAREEKGGLFRCNRHEEHERHGCLRGR